ncbi:MAG TPA: EAL domain-containing protein [Actinomycetota bacterium]|nr:EAL domain-containing protein [Actinomycetota bacterium]
MAIAVAAVLLYAAGVRRLPTLAAGDWFPLPLLAGLFYLAELTVVHFRFRRDAHSFSLSEVPLVLGLFFAAPWALVPAQLLGSAVALTVHRRQPMLKLAFNLSQFALQGALAVVVFRYVVALGDPLGPAGWVAALLATQVTLWVADAAINAAIFLSGDRLPPQAMWEVLGLGVIATAMNTSLALIAVTILARSPASAWLALTPLVVLFVAYQAYSSKRAQHERLEALYEATRALHESPQLESAMVTATSQGRKLLDAQVSEIILLPDAQREVAFSTRLGPGDRVEVMRPIEFDANEDLWRPVVAGRQTILVNRHADDHGYLAERGIHQAVVAPLLGGDRVAGLLVVADRFGDVSAFGQDDVKLLETLANHVSVALENGRLGDSLSQLTRLKEELRHQAFHDHLTGLPNRTLFTERVAYALERQDRAKQSLAVLFLDLDDFKTINDSLGPPAGDQVLVTVAERLRRCIRPSDTVSRLGGDEFGILLDDMTGPSDALVAAERIIQALNAPAYLDGREVSIRASVGITLDTHGEKAETLLRNADVAMYMAKRRGKGRYQVFESSMHAEMVDRLEMTAHLARAIEQHEFTLEYQPIVNLETRSVEGVEALVRWRHPNRGLLAPSEFIPLAEDTGLIVPLGIAVLREACLRAAGWQVPGHPPLAVSVNLSPKQLADPNLVTEVDLALKASGLEPSCLILEMTEDVLMHETDAILHTLREVKSLGVRLAIDDFGTGYSSLSYLERFPVDMLKIAKTFVDQLGNGEPRSPLVEAVIGLGEALGLRTVAEGIETAEQLDRLRGLRCEQGQGYLFARPLDERSIDLLLREGEVALAALPAASSAER